MGLLIKNKLNDDYYMIHDFKYDGYKEYQDKTSDKVYNFYSIDIETTGLNELDSEIIEIAIIRIQADANYNILNLKTIYKSFNEPNNKIPKRITSITGITDSMVKNQFIDWNHVYNLLSKDTKTIFAHNARFERKFISKYIKDDFVWLCTASDIDWYALNVNSRALDYISVINGFTFDHHRAELDAAVVGHLLSCSINGETYLKKILSYANEKVENGYHYVVDKGNAGNDFLKERGFKWNPNQNKWICFNLDEDVKNSLKPKNVKLINENLVIRDLNSDLL